MSGHKLQPGESMEVPIPPEVLDRVRMLELAGHTISSFQSQRRVGPDQFEAELTLTADGETIATMSIAYQSQPRRRRLLDAIASFPHILRERMKEWRHKLL